MNAQIELLEHIQGREVEFISIAVTQGYDMKVLRIKGTIDEVLPQLNFSYDANFGSQELFGYIWYTDGTWSDRGEYDGAEWWQHQERPNQDDEIVI